MGTLSSQDLQRMADQHLWMHFTPMGKKPEGALPIIMRGEGCWIYDANGRPILDALASLFCVNLGHGRRDLAAGVADQIEALAYFSNWGFAHPTAIELAARIAGLAPGDLNRVFFTSGGSESVDSAIKLTRQYHKLMGNTGRYKVIARQNAYHGTTLGALMATGLPNFKEPFEPVAPGGCHVPNVRQLRESGLPSEMWAEPIRDRILEEGPDTVAAVIIEPVQASGGCLVAPDGYFARVREICDEFGILMISDEVICSWGRLGTWFGAEKFGYLPDLITTAKGITSGYAAMGAVIASEKVAEPFVRGNVPFLHGFTFGGNPISSVIAMANINAMDREGIMAHVCEKTPIFRRSLEALADLPEVREVRGEGYFQALELGDSDGNPLTGPDALTLAVELGADLFERGLFCRVDARAGYPILALSPPLVAAESEFEVMTTIIRSAIEDRRP